MEEIFGTTIDTEKKLIEYGKRLLRMGAKNVLISRAAQGAILLCEDGKIISGRAAKGKVVNSVGAGDSMVAGFIAGYMEKKDYEFALKMGLSAGSASAFSNKLATREEVEQLLNVSVCKMEN
jgi:1-phosphofructokinase